MRNKRRLLRVFVALVCLGAVMFVALVGTVSVCAALERAVEPADCIIVLGARVRPDGTLSDSLRYRCESALAAWREDLAPALIVCGAQGGDASGGAAADDPGGRQEVSVPNNGEWDEILAIIW